MTEAPAVIRRWHDMLARRDFAQLQGLLHDDVVFQSPVVHTPQKGRAITSAYLNAAFQVLNNEHFHYLGEWFGDRSAILEFETEIEGVTINGIDMIHWDEQERIVNFKVMVRPLKAINLLHRMMGDTLARMAR